MDYDDKDFQSQNLHLAGEGSTKFPPVLRPYALPKFEFDDSLQGHLRFDSLVETEVFLGIESNEDNRWIEDFSRGSSGIEFSSSAAESCSIARHNNVWSEATSSESVEMLLKSVGQEEIIPRQTIVKELDECDELGCLTKQMEPNPVHDGNILPKTGDVADVQSILPQDEIPENFSGLKGDILVEQPCVEDTLQSHEHEFAMDGTSVELHPNAVGVTSGLPVKGESLLADGKLNDGNRRDVDNLADEYMDDRAHEDTSASMMQVDNVVPDACNIIASGDEVNNQDVQHQVVDISNMDSDRVQPGNSMQEEEFHVLSKEADMNNKKLDGYGAHLEHLGLTSKDESVEGGNSTGGRISNVEEISTMVLNGDSHLHMVERCSEDVGSGIPDEAGNFDNAVLTKDTEVCDPSKINQHEVSPLASKDGSSNEGYAVVVSNPKVSLTYGQETVVEKDDLLESSCHLDNEVLVSESEVSLSPMKENKVSMSEGNENSNSHVRGISSVTSVCSSAEFLSETHETKSLEVVHDASRVSKENLIAEDHKSSFKGSESTQTCEEEKIYGKGNAHKCDVEEPVSEKESTKLPCDSSGVDCGVGGSLIIDKGVGSSSFREGSTGNECIDSKLQFDATCGNESASNAILENAKVSSCDPIAGVLLPSGNVVTADAVISCKEVQMIASSAVELLHTDKKEPTASILSTEARITASIESSKVENEPVSFSETEKDASYDSAVQLSRDTVDQSLPLPESSNAESQSGAQTAVANEVYRECTGGMEMHSVIFDIAVKGGSSENMSSKVSDAKPRRNNEVMLTQTVPFSLEESCCDTGQKGVEDSETTSQSGDKNSRLTAMPNCTSDVFKLDEGSLSSVLPDSQNKLCGLGSGSSSGNCDKSASSPDTIRTAELSQSANEERVKLSIKEGVNGSTNNNGPVSEVIDVDAINVLPISGDPKGNSISTEENSFTFGISSLADLSQKDDGKDSQPFPSISAGKVTPIVEGSPSTSGLVPTNTKISPAVSYGSQQVSEGQLTRGGSKGTHERKTRRGSAKGAGKETAKRGNHAKDTTPTRQSERGDKSTTVSLSPSAIFQFVQSSEMQHYGHLEGSNTKPIFVLTSSTSNLPDLNTSASPSTVFQQPFTDLQQVQLRAQIFVYGALIQGTAPDEAHMISAFGGPDGGKSTWENVWHSCMERLHSQKSHPVTPETPLQSRPGVRAPEQASKQSVLQSKGISSPLGRTSSKGIPTVVNSMIPLSSPLWSIPTTSCDALQSSVMPRGPVMDYQQALTPLHPYQTPPVRNFVGHNTSWVSQVPFRGPWVPSPQTSAPDASARASILSNSETIKSPPIRESSVPHSSGIKHASASPMVQSGVPTSAPPLDPKEVAVSPVQNSIDPKSRRRKKTPVSGDLAQVVLQSQSQPKPVSSPAVTNHLSTSVAIMAPTSKATSEKFVISESPMLSTHVLKRADHDIERRIAVSEETLGKVKEARLQAEDAAALSAAAVSHSQEIWSQLEKEMNSGMVSDVEAKLASAAVAVAAAAAVAKAAAAAASVASNAALQAKLMAEEALVSNGFGNPRQINAASLPDSVNSLGKATPASILKGENGTNSSSSIIIAAKEAARKRVEAASAATKRAENMDAIVKAAELAAEAVSQAGKIVAMGDSFLLSELVEAGPGGYWKVSRESSELVLKSSDTNREQLVNDTVRGGPDTSTKNSLEGPSDKDAGLITKHEKSAIPTEMARELMEDHIGLADGISGTAATNEKDSRGQKGRKVSDLAKTIGVVPESEIGSRSSSRTVRKDYEKAVETFKQNSIKENSLVEVLKDIDGSKAAWFTANVLSLDDGKAYVSYTEFQTDNGEGQLKECVALQGEGDKPPRIRIARPVTALRYEGTRKRRRDAMGDYNWSVGDRVDAWIRDSWWEGVVTEKNKKDETTLTVHFPAHGESSVVRAWHLRPSLVWKDAEWIDSSSLHGNVCTSHEGDTPQEKRLKLGSPAAEAKGKDKILRSKDVVESEKPENPRLLDLSASDRIFNVGKNMKNENKPETLRTIRTGLQKEGSRVIFGVPKPGKKRKFMEVSKHYVADQSNKITEAKDSVKLPKFSMPQGSGSRGWKNNSKSDVKERRLAETKSRAAKSGKPESVSGRTIPAKGNLLSAVSASEGVTLTEHSAKGKDSARNFENAFGKNNQMETGPLSSTEGAVEGPMLFSPFVPSADGTSRKVSTSNTKSERANKGKLAPAGGKLARIEEDKVFNNPAKSTSEVVEPRRSNRRIQPTSRLLEGLQSSLIISKIPSVSYDKGLKNQNRNGSRG